MTDGHEAGVNGLLMGASRDRFYRLHCIPAGCDHEPQDAVFCRELILSNQPAVFSIDLRDLIQAPPELKDLVAQQCRSHEHEDLAEAIKCIASKLARRVHGCAAEVHEIVSMNLRQTGVGPQTDGVKA